MTSLSASASASASASTRYTTERSTSTSTECDRCDVDSTTLPASARPNFMSQTNKFVKLEFDSCYKITDLLVKFEGGITSTEQFEFYLMVQDINGDTFVALESTSEFYYKEIAAGNILKTDNNFDVVSIRAAQSAKSLD